MAKTQAANESSSDPLKNVADALANAAKRAKSGAADAKAATAKAMPAASRFLASLVYNTSYALSYGVVYPAVLIARSIPANNAFVHGFVDGARAASDTVDHWKHPQLEPPAEPLPARRNRAARSPRKSTTSPRPQTRKRKPKTTR
jgi:hypothetical protein